MPVSKKPRHKKKPSSYEGFALGAVHPILQRYVERFIAYPYMVVRAIRGSPILGPSDLGPVSEDLYPPAFRGRPVDSTTHSGTSVPPVSSEQ